VPTELRPPPRPGDDERQRQHRRNIRLAVALGLVAAAFYAAFVILHIRK
jgi:hypothetical protein